ncbi:DUF5690 family protein [Sediminibacterium soli]|uniref:DUF5690 family protein n=1 Tax=Sediminibacterium soli TaxID=2698829 RepID=UPI0013794473|nr:DUF5690 family protein [Sediminibacterium soli]NCI46288.1 hypothetical protein [Sediminibacterium soli]
MSRRITIPALTAGRKDWSVALYASLVTFLTYATVYAFRKPFTVGTFETEPRVLGIPYKDALVVCQVLGYMFSKFYGIRFIAELKKSARSRTILLLVMVSWLALLLFAIVPAPWNIPFLFINGFPLGMIWGVVFSFVEGRKTTDMIGASLSVSFIFSSGFVKSVAKWLMVQWNITEFWVPFVTGLVFLLPLLLLLALLERIPPPSASDTEVKMARPPMDTAQRKKFFARFSTGIVLLVVVYVLLTIFRDIRDNFAADIWKELGYGNQPEIFTSTEIPITLFVLLLISSMMFIRNSAVAFRLTHWIILAGFVVSGLSSFLFISGWLNGYAWMLLAGLGLYIGYIPFNCILFDRMIAALGSLANVGFLMYLADSFGYLGSVGVIMAKTFFHIRSQWSVLYSNGVVVFSLLGIPLTLMALYYFNRKIPKPQFT